MEVIADDRPDKSPDLEGCIFNVSFRFSDWILCVGMEYMGGNPSCSRNYRFNHANICISGKQIDELIEGVSKNDALRILKNERIFLRDICSYLQ